MKLMKPRKTEEFPTIALELSTMPVMFVMLFFSSFPFVYSSLLLGDLPNRRIFGQEQGCTAVTQLFFNSHLLIVVYCSFWLRVWRRACKQVSWIWLPFYSLRRTALIRESVLRLQEPNSRLHWINSLKSYSSATPTTSDALSPTYEFFFF